jgi:hypothetical protein
MRRPTTAILYTDPKISDPPIRQVKIHPLVIFKMSDAYERSPGPDRLSIGVILGEHHDGVATVHDCYPCLPDAVNVVEPDLNRRMFDRHRQLFPNEVVLGYYAFSQQRVEWPNIFEVHRHGIHIWMRPTLPPKWDVFEITKNSPQGPLIASPIEYVIDASPDEQLGLSRLADSHGQGSLQPAVWEMRALLGAMKDFCLKKKGNLPKDKLVGRDIYVALQQANLKGSAAAVLIQANKDIDVFREELTAADAVVKEKEDQLSIPFD